MRPQVEDVASLTERLFDIMERKLNESNDLIRLCLDCPAVRQVAAQYTAGDLLCKTTVECKVDGPLARRILSALGEEPK